MARGKYKSTAEARQVRESAIQEAERLRRENARLQRQMAADRAEAAERHAHDTQAVAEMRERLETNTDPRVTSLAAKVAGLKHDLVDLTADRDARKQVLSSTFAYLLEHFTHDHGMTPGEARDRIDTDFGIGDDPRLQNRPTPNITGVGSAKLSPDTRKRLQDTKAIEAWTNPWVSQRVESPK